MSVTRYRLLSVLSVLPWLIVGTYSSSESQGLFDSVAMTPSPAPAGSGEPNLHVAGNGSVYLSWVDTADKEQTLRFALAQSDGWSEPRTIATGNDWFVNWADFPSLAEFEDGSLAAHWLQKSGENTYAYDVKISRSRDGGASWSAPLKPHRDRTETEHGFVSMVPWRDDKMLVAWLDGRNTAESGGHDAEGDGKQPAAMTIRAALLDSEGRLSEETLIDNRVCDCCQTSAVRTPSGVIVAYRDRSDDEVRDISIARYRDGGWDKPHPLHDDGWEIAGCPVNGAALAALDRSVAAAWFTGAGNVSRIRVSFSNDEGATFGAPIDVDDGRPLGRVDVVLLPGNEALVSWLETADGGAEIRVRRVAADGKLTASETIAKTSEERGSGFPRMARSGDRIYFAWTDTTDPAQVRTAVAKIRP